MIELNDILGNKVTDKEKLLKYGFSCVGGEYTMNIPILSGQFTLHIFVSETGFTDYSVTESKTNEEYILVKVPSANGGFVGEVRNACEEILNDISNQCFYKDNIQSEQAKRMVEFIKSELGAKPEFLWEKYPNYAAFRLNENQKWFAVIMTVDKSKIGLPEHESIEIIDLKDIPENLESRIDNEKFFKAYHMNKKHWYTVCLNGSICDDELKELIKKSYELVASKGK